MDQGRKMADRKLRELERKLGKEYAKAQKEVQAKLDEHFRLFKIKDATKRRQVKEGKITVRDYQKWRAGQMATGKRWEHMRNVLANDLQNTKEIARNITDGYRAEAYALSHNWIGYTVEHGLKVDTSFTLYNAEAIERIIRENPDLLPPPGKRMAGKLKKGEAIKWQEGQIQSITMQSILQGESIPNMARRISRDLAVKEMGDAIRYARTAMTGAENAGRLDAMRYAQSIGVKLDKQWFASLDDRTREAHRELDGQVVPLNEPFVNSIGEIMFPGDTDADGDNYWNCRCSCEPSLHGFETDPADLGMREHSKLGDMSYDEWRTAKAKSKDIEAPIKTEKIMKMRYIRDYRR